MWRSVRILAAVCVVFAAVGACSPRLKRRYFEEQLERQQQQQRRLEQEQRVKPGQGLFGTDQGFKGIRGPSSYNGAFDLAPSLVDDIPLAERPIRNSPAIDIEKAMEGETPTKQQLQEMLALSWQMFGKSLDDVSFAPGKANGNSDLICKTAPYNICYRLDEKGVLHPTGDRRPVRILRVY